ncbi:hypothetical protein PCASD_24946 [Puccinia coronata f. sp. avenae]|uniref:Uncharacterized protein n=1 Tax=Puccinia coronata f. sp. avenae TaxID=200324 RepID=A0A2N5S611_9BASI|nr:hypothetical protein PCASD_24946 [Puccinia coronata f. sp. avenae]
MDSAANLNKDTVHAGLKLTMDDQGAIKKQAAVEAEAEEHLLSAETARIASTSCPHADSQNPNLNLNANNFEETINIRMEDIYQANPANAKYKKNIPVYLHPTDKNQYIPLTPGTTQIWSQALIEHMAGVSVSSPPSSLKFVKLSSKKRRLNALIGSSSSEMGQVLAELLSNQNQPASPSGSDAVASSEDESDPPAISGYVKFVNIDEDKRASVMKILDKNKVNDYRMFKSKSITVTNLKCWGLKGGTLAHLLDNVTKYKAYLAKK